MAGMVLYEQHETVFIQEIVEMVEDKLTPMAENNDPHLIGMESRVKDIEIWLRSDNLTDLAGILVICGMGGVGKTTAAKFVYRSNRRRFDARCFLENIRATPEKSNYLPKLLRKLLSEIIRKEVNKMCSLDEILMRIQYALKNKKVLLVLDDVDEVDQSNAILGIRNWLTPGSKIIITTRREDLPKEMGKCKEHRIEKMSDDESHELFSWHAFGKTCPNEDFMVMSQKFVQYCQGLPLALEVLSSSVSGKSLDIWASTLDSLEELLDARIVEKLKISYYSLQYQRDRDLFLDIACFFVGKNKNKTIDILDGCGYYTALGIEKLVDRSLLTVEKGKLGMHQLLQHMGRQIVYEESNYPEERSRLWRHKESFNILSEQNGTLKIEGLTLDMNMMKKSKVLTTNIRCPWKAYFWRNSDEDVFETIGFKNMSKLRQLRLNNVQLFGTYNAFPTNLRWLSWRGFNLRSLPNGFPPKNIVCLDLRYSCLEQVWNEIKVLESLKTLNLSHSTKLTRTPDFSGIPNLERLLLKGCKSLVKIDKSIVQLERLICLNLQDCINLIKLPKNIGMVKSIEQLVISGCSSLVGAADEIVNMELRKMYADGTLLHQLLTSKSNSEFESQYLFRWLWVANPKRNPEISWTSLPRSLVTLSLNACNLSNNDFPKSFGDLPKLRYLYLGQNQISSLPECIGNLTGLLILGLSSSPRLKQISWPSLNVEELDVSGCRLLEQITLETSNRPKKIVHAVSLNLNYAESFFKIKPVQEVDVETLNNFGFFHLGSMANVEVTIVNCIVWSRKRLPIQILYDQRIFCTYFPGTKVPTWFSNTHDGSTITFIVPSLSFPIRGLNLCVVYTHAAGIIHMSVPISVTIKNKSKGLEEKFTPRCCGIPEEDGDMVWLIHWPFWVAQVDKGDEVEVSFNMDVDAEMKECGVQILHFFEEEGGAVIQHYSEALFSSWHSAKVCF